MYIYIYTYIYKFIIYICVYIYIILYSNIYLSSIQHPDNLFSGVWVQLILHPANQGPKLLLMLSMPKCRVRVRSFDWQKLRSSVCWLRVVIWMKVQRPWMQPMRLTKQHPFLSVSTLQSQRQRQRVPQRLLRPICGGF